MQVAAAFTLRAGSIGGMQAASTRAGVTLRARRPHQQPNTAAQSLARSALSDLPGIWRSLLPSERHAWAEAATHLSGYALFCQLNRNLRTLGIEPSIYTPPVLPTFPSLLAIALDPIYDQVAPPRALVGWLLTYRFSDTPSSTAVLRTTSPHSPTRTVFARSDFKLTTTFQPQVAGTFPLDSAWTPVHGQPPMRGALSAVLSLIDPASGYESPRSRIATSWVAERIAFQTPSGVTIEVESETVAVIPAGVVEVEGQPVAGQ